MEAVFDRHKVTFFQKKKVSVPIKSLCVYGCKFFFQEMVYFMTQKKQNALVANFSQLLSPDEVGGL